MQNDVQPNAVTKRDDVLAAEAGAMTIRNRLRTRSGAIPAWLTERKLKVLDFDLNALIGRLHLLLGDSDLVDWRGDGWSHRPYQVHAGTVWPQYVSHTLCLDVSRVLVTESCDLDDFDELEWSKDDLKRRVAPILDMSFDFDRGVRVYMGDVISVPATGPLALLDVPFVVERGLLLVPSRPRRSSA